MNVCSRPYDEESRLQNLAQYGVLDTETETDFDDLASLAAQLCNCSMGVITFVDRDRQWFKAKKGISVVQTQRQISFCTHTIMQDDVFVVENALADARFTNNPLVTGRLGIRFYAGCPIVSPEGFKLGSVCVLDETPRELTAEQNQALRIISVQISRLLELRLQHNQLKEESSARLAVEKETVQTILRSREQDKQSMSAELHENFAQVLAAVKLQLDLAEQQHESGLPHLQQAKSQVIALLGDMRQLSRKLAPLTLTTTNATQLVEGLAQRFALQMPVLVEYKATGAGTLDEPTALALFRILEDQMQLIKQKKNVTEVVLQLDVTDAILLEVKDDGQPATGAAVETTIINNTIRNRAEMHGGRTQHSHNEQGFHTLSVRLPLRQPKARPCMA